MIHDIELLRTPEYREKLNQCIHCGLCLQACPTYAIFASEMDAPRGRIALIRAAAEGRVELEDFKESVTQHLALCLGCRACETACPSGVKYGELIETARVVVERNREPGLAERILRWAGTKQLMPNLRRLRLAARMAWFYERSGLQQVVRALGFLPKTLKAMEAILPPIRLEFTALGRAVPAAGERRGRVLFFTGCIQEGFLSQVNQATLRVLQHNGYEVFTPVRQTCCGAASLHLGEVEAARDLARRNIDAFLNFHQEYQAVICNAGGCGVALKEYPHLLADDPVYAARAREFSAQVKDINEFLAGDRLAPPQGRVEARATYADSCHLRHGQKVVRQPRELLREIPGLTLVELSQPDQCCGSAGVYNIAQAEAAERVLDAKMADIAATGADLIVTSNTGCHMQLIAGVRRAGLKARVMHVVEVLDMAYRAEVEG